MLIQVISMVLFPPSYLFWKARYGSCRFFVYLLYPDGANDSEHALYIVGKTFQWEFSAIEIMEIGSVFMEKTRNRFGSSSDKDKSCFPNISPTALWISVKFNIYGKPLSRRIQRRRLRDMRTSFH